MQDASVGVSGVEKGTADSLIAYNNMTRGSYFIRIAMQNYKCNLLKYCNVLSAFRGCTRARTLRGHQLCICLCVCV